MGVLTWMTMEGRLGDTVYGWLLMLLMAFPLSIVTLLIEIPLGPVVEAQSYEVRQVLYYVQLALPGVVLATLLLAMVGSASFRALGRGFAWLATACVLVSGLLVVLDKWEPRRPYGWPLLACGIGMAAGLFAGRAAARGAQTR
ncbi:hypothetical protein ACFFWE_25960 [Sphaerisporangium melleum]|uniref:hypothetical protein n=1 Tax=Sphaerisporangium melleum TaxID=321316 RepID=UPI00166C877F|nr:hypothetical protein [Sphaerisporangium melleum]